MKYALLASTVLGAQVVLGQEASSAFGATSTIRETAIEFGSTLLPAGAFPLYSVCKYMMVTACTVSTSSTTSVVDSTSATPPTIENTPTILTVTETTPVVTVSTSSGSVNVTTMTTTPATLTEGHPSTSVEAPTPISTSASSSSQLVGSLGAAAAVAFGVAMLI